MSRSAICAPACLISVAVSLEKYRFQQHQDGHTAPPGAITPPIFAVYSQFWNISASYLKSRGLMWNVLWKALKNVEYSLKPACSAAFITGCPARISSPASSIRFWVMYWWRV